MYRQWQFGVRVLAHWRTSIILHVIDIRYEFIQLSVCQPIDVSVIHPLYPFDDLSYQFVVQIFISVYQIN